MGAMVAESRSSSNLAQELARLIRGEIDFRDFPWLASEERRALGALGMAMLKSAKADAARAAFGVLIDLEPDEPVHHLMYAHACSLADIIDEAFRYFGKTISLALQNEAALDVAAEAFLGRGELLLKLGRTVEARADLADAATRLDDPVRIRAIEAYLAR
jgi:tetratricopeptide (TPR) repeat protein